MAESDLSNLPDLVLLKLFKMLPVCDRGRLASCSWRLPSFMDCASVWRSVVLDLDMDIVPVGRHGHSREIVGSLRASDRLMIEKYGEHFERVKVVISNPYIENSTWDLLIQLSQRNVIKCVSLRFDQTYLKAVKYFREHSQAAWHYCGHIPIDTLTPRTASRPAGMPRTIGDLVENLGSETDIRVKLPTRNVGLQQTEQLYILGGFTTKHFYLNPKSNKFCGQLTKLILSSERNSEQALARKYRRLSSPPTAQLISTFPSLQELHVNITNLSDKLLLELSKVPEKRQPLQRMVMNHMFCDSQFPKLSSSAWEKLANACPGLRVECCVVGSSLLTLHEVIKPQTPLVRLRVTCVSTEASLLALYELCHGQGDRLEQLEVRAEGEVWGREAVQEGWRGLAQACPSLRPCWGLVTDMESF